MAVLFEAELAMFDKHRRAWSQEHAGEWVVIRGSESLGFFPSIGAAYDAADHAYGEPGFMIKQVCAQDEPIIVSHLRVRGAGA